LRETERQNVDNNLLYFSPPRVSALVERFLEVGGFHEGRGEREWRRRWCAKNVWFGRGIRWH
jgi:hypothetical protein